MLDKVVASFFIGSIGFDGGAADRGPGVGASSWLRLLKILMRQLLVAVDQFQVLLRWLNANVASTRYTGTGPLPIVSENFQHLQ